MTMTIFSSIPRSLIIWLISCIFRKNLKERKKWVKKYFYLVRINTLIAIRVDLFSYMEISNCKIIQLNKNNDHRGQLTFIEGNKDVPFTIKRIYYFHNVPSDCKRGAHAHKNNLQILIALNGSFEVNIDNGMSKKNYLLNNAQQGLYIGEMIWRELKNFSPDAICLVLASQLYDSSDYIYNYEDFLNLILSTVQ